RRTLGGTHHSPGEIVVRVRPSPAVDGLPVEEPPTPMATTPASLTLRGTTDGRAVFVVITVIILLICSVRCSLGEGRNDRQSDKDGLAKNISCRGVWERLFHSDFLLQEIKKTVK